MHGNTAQLTEVVYIIQEEVYIIQVDLRGCTVMYITMLNVHVGVILQTQPLVEQLF